MGGLSPGDTLSTCTGICSHHVPLPGVVPASEKAEPCLPEQRETGAGVCLKGGAPRQRRTPGHQASAQNCFIRALHGAGPVQTGLQARTGRVFLNIVGYSGACNGTHSSGAGALLPRKHHTDPRFTGLGFSQFPPGPDPSPLCPRTWTKLKSLP